MVDGLPLSQLITDISGVVSNLGLTESLKKVIQETVGYVNGNLRRRLMAKTVEAFCKGGQRKAEQDLNWNRGTIRKGTFELKTGIHCIDN